jgi:hypothetical protein
MPNDWKSGKWGHLWRTRHPKTNCLISAYAGMPCTTCVKGQVGQVWACPDASGRLYGCGNTGQNTDLLEIEYPKNSLFKSDKWAPAPPRWLVYTWSCQIWHSLLQTRLALPSLHIFTWNPSPCKPCILVCTKFTLAYGLHPCSWEHTQGLPEPETTLTKACDTRATQRSLSVDGFI